MAIDIIVLIVVLISAFIAFLRGFIREVLTILGVVGGLAAAYYAGPKLAPLMRGWFGVQEGVEPQKLFDIIPYNILADALSYGLIFLVVVIVLSIISHMLAESARSIGLGAVDRSLGVVFGVARGILLLGIVYLPVYMWVPQEKIDEWFKDSRSHFYLQKTAAVLYGYLPENHREKAEENAKTLEGKIDGVKSARDALKDINLLSPTPKEAAPPTEQELQGQDPQKGGYDQNFRENMDQLFEEKKLEPDTSKIPQAQPSYNE